MSEAKFTTADTEIALISSAPIVYTMEGEKIAKRLWKETMEEASELNSVPEPELKSSGVVMYKSQ